MKREKGYFFYKYSKVFVHFALILGFIIVTAPFIWMLITSVKGSKEAINPLSLPKALHLENYLIAWKKANFFRYFLNSYFIALATTLGQVITGVLAGYAFARMNFPYKKAIFTLFLATMMLPQQVLLIPNYIILSDFGWIDRFESLIIPWLAMTFTIYFIRQHIEQIPRDLFEAAEIDGCSPLKSLFVVALPLSKPVILASGLFAFVGGWNSFLWPLIVTNSDYMRTIQVGLAAFSQESGTEWHLLMAASTISVLPLVILFFFVQKQFIHGLTAGGLKES